jgi:HAD superfamily hydrolase (TIGR01509 family)
MSIRAVIFDRDETLTWFDQTAIQALEAEITELAPELPLSAVSHHWQTWPRQWPRSEDEEPAFWHTFWNDLAIRFDLAAPTIPALQQISSRYHLCNRAFPDAGLCLQSLRKRGLRLAVLTNFELPSIERTLEHTGLDPAWFAALLSSSTLGVSKPDHRAYRAAAAVLGLPPEDCAFVDDLPPNVEAACEVGMRGVLLDRQQIHSATTLPAITSLDQLVGLLGDV